MVQRMTEHTPQAERPTIEPRSFVNAAPVAVAAPSDTDCVVHNLETGATYRLNDVGARIWELVETGTTITEVTATLRAEFQLSEDVTPQQVTDDVVNVIADLHQYGLVVIDASDQR
jgi:hypothetical protein